MFKRPLAFMTCAVLILFSLAACGNTGSTDTTTPTTAPTATPSPTPSPTPAPFQVTSIDMAVNPTSIAGMSCGTNLTVNYTATFHIAPNSAGGTIQFIYTTNNGRSTPSASVTVAAGETTKTYSFVSTGTLNPDNVFPGLGGVITSSPNAVTSPTIKPTGTCTPTAAFQVTSVDMSVNPTSIAGKTCGTYLVVTYTATFHIAPNGPGGTIQFEYTTNNGRGTSIGSVTVGAGETVKTFAFNWSGNLPADHVYPENGGVIVTSPNALNPVLLGPTGQCS